MEPIILTEKGGFPPLVVFPALFIRRGLSTRAQALVNFAKNYELPRIKSEEGLLINLFVLRFHVFFLFLFSFERHLALME